MQSSDFTLPYMQRNSTTNVMNIAETQKQPQSATMTCNQDINNSINLRRNVMRVMHEAKQNVRRWANYVNEDRANLTKSLDCRGKTANTSKTKMTSAIMIINNLEKEFKADNKLILRLTDTDSLTTSISSEKWPKTKSRNTRSKIPSEQPEDMRKQRSQKWSRLKGKFCRKDTAIIWS
ncbi:hypothetical protein B9Z55_028248 [Caenorhabditis nigoni]|nr:hypothetical protein B9Z55_028248 [Caenorhabditis nigoni]